jgi:hypothetical protein
MAVLRELASGFAEAGRALRTPSGLLVYLTLLAVIASLPLWARLL